MNVLAIPSSSKEESSRKDILLEELNHLKWYKLANNKALKVAISQQKSAKSKSDAPSIHNKSKRLSSPTIEQRFDFYGHPLDSDSKTAKLSNQIEWHINTLHKLKQKLEDQTEIQTRTQQYRVWKKDLDTRKQMVLDGNLSISTPSDHHTLPHTLSPTSYNMSNNLVDESENMPLTLQKVAELEKRIQMLENKKTDKSFNTSDSDSQINPKLAKSTAFPYLSSNSSSGTPQAGYKLTGSTSRSVGGLRTSVASSHNNLRTSKAAPYQPKYGQFYKDQRTKKQQAKSAYSSSSGGKSAGRGAFLTQLYGPIEEESEGDEERSVYVINYLYKIHLYFTNDVLYPLIYTYTYREEITMDRRRRLAQASEGQKHLRQRMQNKKQRAKDAFTANEKHGQALKRSQQLKSSYTSKSTTGGLGRKNGVSASTVRLGLGRQSTGVNGRVQASKGASAGPVKKNKYMNEFERMKAEFQRKRGMYIGYTLGHY